MNLLSSRGPLIRFIALAGLFQFGLTLTNTGTGKPVMNIKDYMQTEIKQRVQFIVTGVIKPNSVKVKALEKRFKITDNQFELQCVFNGPVSIEFKEGDLAILESYCPNNNAKNNIIVKSYLSKHSMESNQWQGKSKVDKGNYGIESF